MDSTSTLRWRRPIRLPARFPFRDRRGVGGERDDRGAGGGLVLRPVSVRQVRHAGARLVLAGRGARPGAITGAASAAAGAGGARTALPRRLPGLGRGDRLWVAAEPGAPLPDDLDPAGGGRADHLELAGNLRADQI